MVKIDINPIEINPSMEILKNLNSAIEDTVILAKNIDKSEQQVIKSLTAVQSIPEEELGLGLATEVEYPTGETDATGLGTTAEATGLAGSGTVELDESATGTDLATGTGSATGLVLLNKRKVE